MFQICKYIQKSGLSFKVLCPFCWVRLSADSELPEQTKVRWWCECQYIKDDNLGSKTPPGGPDNLQPKISHFGNKTDQKSGFRSHYINKKCWRDPPVIITLWKTISVKETLKLRGHGKGAQKMEQTVSLRQMQHPSEHTEWKFESRGLSHDIWCHKETTKATLLFYSYLRNTDLGF